MSASLRHTPASAVAPDAAAPGHSVSATVVGYGTAAAVTFVFNTVLAWVKDAWDPLNSFMAQLTGHHWITHGLADIAVFLVLGYVLTSRRAGRPGDGVTLAMTLVAAALVAGGGLALWFLVV